MKATIKQLSLIGNSVLWLVIYELAIFDNGRHFGSSSGMTLMWLLLMWAVLLPFVGLPVWRAQRHGSLYRLFLFVASLVPAMIALTVTGFVILVSLSLD